MIASFGMTPDADEQWVWDCIMNTHTEEKDEDGRVIREWHGYTVDYAGVVIDSKPTDGQPFAEYNDEIVELRIQRAFFEDCPVYAVILWDSLFGTRASIHGIEDYRSKEDLTKIGWKCLGLLGHLSQRGRRRLEDVPGQPARAIADSAREIKRKHPRLSWELIAKHHLNVERSQLFEILKRFPE